MGFARTPDYPIGGAQYVSKESIVGKGGHFNVWIEVVRLSSQAGMVLVQEFAEKLGVG
jgi:hypothetical protein